MIKVQKLIFRELYQSIRSISRLYRLILIQDNYTGDVWYVSVIFMVDDLANIFFVIWYWSDFKSFKHLHVEKNTRKKGCNNITLLNNHIDKIFMLKINKTKEN